jgi:cysteine desulfurase / selenocysteine lyase
MPASLAETIRPDFPILATSMNGRPLIYLDNGATTQKPQAVIDAIVHFYTHDNANIHRGVYPLSQRATDAYEEARRKVAGLLGVDDPAECIFVRGATEAINLVAMSWGQANLNPGSEVLLTGLEHHSNIVPWQMACERTGAKLRILPTNEKGELELSQLDSYLNSNTRMVAMQHVSNALGTLHDVETVIARAREVGARVMIDGAQWVGHYPTNLSTLDCDFYAFSGHKLFGPTGIGVLWGKRDCLEQMPPYQGGGDMIDTVTFEKTTYAPLPNRFEAGTPDIAGAIGLGAAIDYVQGIGWDRIVAYEHELLEYATQRMQAVPGLRIIGNAKRKASVLSFVIEEPVIAALDIAMRLSNEGICVRTGHHCCMPLMNALGITGTCRASLAMYNTRQEIDRLVEVLHEMVTARKSRQDLASSVASAQGADSSDLSQQISFAEPLRPTLQQAAEELIEEFLLFDDTESKTELLMELGQGLPDLFAALKAISAPVPGCMSEVYLIGRPDPDQPDKFQFAGDANAEIVRGLIKVLQMLFSGQSAQEILKFDVEQLFRKIGLDQFVSSQRRSGLDGMIRRIRTLAQAIAERQ